MMSMLLEWVSCLNGFVKTVLCDYMYVDRDNPENHISTHVDNCDCKDLADITTLVRHKKKGQELGKAQVLEIVKCSPIDFKFSCSIDSIDSLTLLVE